MLPTTKHDYVCFDNFSEAIKQPKVTENCGSRCVGDDLPDLHLPRRQQLFNPSNMSTVNHNAATTLPIHDSTNTVTTVNDIASASQHNKLLPSQNNNSLSSQNNNSYPSQPTSTQSSANTNPSNPTTIQPTSLPSHISIAPSILQNSLTINKTRIKNVPENVKIRNVPENIKDWDKTTLFERLEATTDLPLTRFSEYGWRIENEQPRLNPWPPRQQRKD
ncbi:hypothetical protein KCU99_g9382, partial [Aureobasidium melanogenum]